MQKKIINRSTGKRPWKLQGSSGFVNLSGMILVDFINMKNTNDQSELLQYMGSLVRSDPMQTVVVDVTALGIMEITRKKSAKTLAEQLLQLKKGE